MSKTLKSVFMGIVALIIVGILGYGVYSYATKTGYFKPAETELTEAVEEVQIGE